MRPRLSHCLACLLVCLPLVLPAQRRIEGARQAQSHYMRRSGAFGYVHLGLTNGFLSNLSNDLNTENALRTPALAPATEQEFVANGFGQDLGGQLGYLLREKWIVLGGVNYREFTATQTFRGEAWQRSLTYGLQVGYAIRNRDQVLLYPYLGYYLGESRLRIANYHSEDIEFGDLTIARAGQTDLTANAGHVDLGFAAQYQLGRSGNGLMLGAQAGVYIAAGGGDWQTASGTTVGGVSSTGSVTGVYLRATIGLGFFQIQRERPTRTPDADPNVQDLFQQPGGNTTPGSDLKRDRNSREFDRARSRRQTPTKSRRQERRDRKQPADYDDVDGR